MAKILSIKQYPDSVLNTQAEPVEEITPEIRTLIMDMWETMDALNGLGLAATQVGVMKRVIVFKDGDGHNVELINPEIMEFEGEVYQQESCFSIPGFSGVVKRHAAVTVRGLDMHGFERMYDSIITSVNAYALQHEIDHLDGVLFIERGMNRKSRQAWKKHCRKRR